MKLKSLVCVLGLLLSLIGFAQNPFPCELSGGEGDPATGGESATQEGQFHDNSAYFNIIEINEPVTLVSAKVFANGPGPRTLAILSAEGDPLTFEVFDLPDGEHCGIQLGLGPRLIRLRIAIQQPATLA